MNLLKDGVLLSQFCLQNIADFQETILQLSSDQVEWDVSLPEFLQIPFMLLLSKFRILPSAVLIKRKVWRTKQGDVIGPLRHRIEPGASFAEQMSAVEKGGQGGGITEEITIG